MIRRLLVANRGEIARRVFHTCRDLGIETVAVFSDADADAPFVREADRAVRLPGMAPDETYLRGDLIVAAARESGADAVHPGYGFLSENAEFAEQVIAAGLTWVGPPPEAIAAMGSKIAAKRLMSEAGVPVLPQFASEPDSDDPRAVAHDPPDTLADAAFPLLIKASAGGGGRGMRIVRDPDDLPAQLESARDEAQSAFGDPTVFCEPYVETGRHIEMQVLADTHGNVWLLGERDCSIQRRHQKVIEESPSPVVTPELRAELTAAAKAATKAIGYVGAGTVEFLLDVSPGGQMRNLGAKERPELQSRREGAREGAGETARGGDAFFFLEMNTRLQVEHPVTECRFGLDLVAMQIAVAEGSPLDGEPPEPRGHAIEARVYAEDPAAEWQPQTGTVHRFGVPDVDARFGRLLSYGLRLDSGVEPGSEVSPHYDAMLAKLVTWGPTRQAAVRRLGAALARTELHGVRTNRDLLVRVLDHPEFRAGDFDTGFLERQDLRTPLADDRTTHVAALAAALADAASRRVGGLPIAWRNVRSDPLVKEFVAEGRDEAVGVSYRCDRDRLVAVEPDDVEVLDVSPGEVTLAADGVVRRFAVETTRETTGETAWVDGPGVHVGLRRVPRLPDPAAYVATGALLAPMPGVVVSVAVADGEVVAEGQTVLVLEAMKMRHTIAATEPGVVTAVDVRPGQQVEAGAVLAVVTPEGDET
ncbi:MAG: ATP-grasp domain-containing protein [Propionibacteriales bacterium]|nr:ATP-grasp domain-containing protein [Propionibacteriales bacterium]